MDKTEPASEAKDRIETEAITYVKQFNWRPSYQDVDSRKDYIAGATAEYNRAQEEITRLKAELERERELRKEAIEVLFYLYSSGYLHGVNYNFKIKIEALIEKAKN